MPDKNIAKHKNLWYIQGETSKNKDPKTKQTMDQQKQDLIEKLRGANNVLVTVSSNPSVDQLAACIGITLFLNKMNKHGTAVFSGSVPSTIDFLRPEETLEKNTDSLRDFIIALDKAKADKLRYKVEQNVVKIFITPYKTSITQEDLDFSQGDFNVDVVLCLGIQQQQDLDQAITAHGRILHDAVVTSINTVNTVDLASISWVNPNASSLSEMVIEVADALGKELMDGQIATAMLTGIVAETDRFSNEKTTPETMRLSAELMAAGANQQLVASELQAPLKIEEPGNFTEVKNEDEVLPPAAPVNQDGTLEIDHPEGEQPTHNDTDHDSEASNDSNDQPPAGPGPDTYEVDESANDTEQSDEQPAPTPEQQEDQSQDQPDNEQPASRMMLQPPSMGGTLTANTIPEGNDASVDPLTLASLNDPRNDEAANQKDDVITNGQTSSAASDDVVPPIDDAADAQTAGTPTTDEVTDKAADHAPDAATPIVEDVEPLVLPDVSAEADTPDSDEHSEDMSIDVPLDNQVPDLPIVPAIDPAQPTPEISIDANGNFQMPSSAEAPAPETLADIEHAVEADEQSTANLPEGVDDARSAVLDAINNMPGKVEAEESVGAGGYLNVQDLPDEAEPLSSPVMPPVPAAFPIEPPVLLDESPLNQVTDAQLPLPTSLMPPPADPTPPTSVAGDAGAPPPVPPPIITDPTQFLKDQKA